MSLQACGACKGEGWVKPKGGPAKVCPECKGACFKDIEAAGEAIQKASDKVGAVLTRRADSGERIG